MRSRLLLAAITVIGMPALAQAQYNRKPAAHQRQMQPQFVAQTSIQGEIEGIMRGSIIVLDANNQRWQVIIPPNVEVQVTGEASTDYLQPGLLVEFEAQLEGRGMKDKVNALTIITPTPAKQPSMVLMDASGGDAGGAAGTKPVKRGTTVPGKYHIIGQLTAGRGGKFNVQAGRGSMPLELADQVAVKVDVADLTIVAKGDKVTIQGNKAAGPANVAKANRVKIVLAEPLGGTPAKTKATPVKKPAKRPAKGTDASKPAAEQ